MAVVSGTTAPSNTEAVLGGDGTKQTASTLQLP